MTVALVVDDHPEGIYLLRCLLAAEGCRAVCSAPVLLPDGPFGILTIYRDTPHAFSEREVALVSAFAFLLFATMPLLNHLGRPDRAFNIVITPNFHSAMSGFGFVYAFYGLIVFLEIWFHYRGDFIERWRASRGIAKKLYFVLLLGATRCDGETGACVYEPVPECP